MTTAPGFDDYGSCLAHKRYACSTCSGAANAEVGEHKIQERVATALERIAGTADVGRAVSAATVLVPGEVCVECGYGTAGRLYRDASGKVYCIDGSGCTNRQLRDQLARERTKAPTLDLERERTKWIALQVDVDIAREVTAQSKEFTKQTVLMGVLVLFALLAIVRVPDRAPYVVQAVVIASAVLGIIDVVRSLLRRRRRGP